MNGVETELACLASLLTSSPNTAQMLANLPGKDFQLHNPHAMLYLRYV